MVAVSAGMLEAVQALVPPGAVVELRVPDFGGRTGNVISGYYNDLPAMRRRWGSRSMTMLARLGGARCGKILRTGGRGAPPSMGSAWPSSPTVRPLVPCGYFFVESRRCLT
jgi:hypothetical protein